MIKAITFAIRIGFSMTSNANEIFIHSHNPTSNRFAILEDNESIAFLYLTEVGTQRPVKDAVVYSRKPLIPKFDWEKVKETADAPPLSQDVASSEAIITTPSEGEFSFKWSFDGNAVALLRNGEPIAFASASEEYGFSKAISKPNPLANAWDQELYEFTFREQP
ncbi:hypothetical protein HUF18_07475 [Thalassolituus sp. ST750PaO-4]|uniref:hypothetical protein n=1 Tax=Thalassolituus sp. ST750PaO-4 TaxID=2742965 RepID=UPI001CE2741E|nr:hypothetical protein [Thalassolituus sp. ST750PaO-4]MCA6059616.1 hypothetical protein [Thalassolituus sp. ST750PaO-4]